MGGSFSSHVPHLTYRREVLREVVEDLGVAQPLLLFAHRHLEREREAGAPEDLLEGRRHHPTVSDDLNDPLGLHHLAVCPAERDALMAVRRPPPADPGRATPLATPL